MFFLSIFVVIIYAVSIYFSPFPYWKTYFVLWYAVLTHPESAINVFVRLRHAFLLMRYLLLCPLWTCLWYLDDLFFPHYKTMPIRPVFIVGQPRSGTTFLHRTLAADEDNFFAVRHLEWRYPFIIVQKILANTGIAAWIASRDYWPGSAAGRIAAKMHPNKLSDWEEDGIFYEECFLHHFFVFLRFPYPTLLAYLDDFPGLPQDVQDKILQTHKLVLQKVMYLRGRDKYYLSKEVTSHNKFFRLQPMYPDARFIFSLRPSVEFMSSLMALARFSTRSKTGVDPSMIPGWEIEFVARMQRDAALLVHLSRIVIPEDRQVKLRFAELNRDPATTIMDLYGALGLAITPVYHQYLVGLRTRQKERERGYDYKKITYEGFEDFDAFVKGVTGFHD